MLTSKAGQPLRVVSAKLPHARGDHPIVRVKHPRRPADLTAVADGPLNERTCFTDVSCEAIRFPTTQTHTCTLRCGWGGTPAPLGKPRARPSTARSLPCEASRTIHQRAYSVTTSVARLLLRRVRATRSGKLLDRSGRCGSQRPSFKSATHLLGQCRSLRPALPLVRQAAGRDR